MALRTIALRQRPPRPRGILFKRVCVVLSPTLMLSCLMKPSTDTKPNDQAQQAEAGGPSTVRTLAQGGLQMAYDILNNKLEGRSILLKSMNLPQTLLWQGAQAQQGGRPTAEGAGSYDLLCTAWFDSYLSGKQKQTSGVDQQSSREVENLEQVRYCAEHKILAADNKPQGLVRLWRMCQGQKQPEVKPVFRMIRALRLEHHASIMARPDRLTCEPWRPTPEGNQNILGTVVQFSFARNCSLDCTQEATLPACVQAKKEGADTVTFQELAEFPTERLIQRATSSTAAKIDQCDF
jgi:hypothetical protein